MKRIIALIISIVLVGGVVGCTQNTKNTSGEKEDGKLISIGKVPYPHEWIPLNVIKQVAEEQGYRVEEVEGDIGFMFLGLSQGSIDILPDVWLPILHKNYMDKYEGKIDLVNTLYEKTEMGLGVPSYVEVDSIAELNKNAELFDNRIVGIEPSTGMMLTAEETIEDYNMDNIELVEGSTPAMLAEVDKAAKNNEPVLFLAWRPHVMFLKYDIKILKDEKNIWKYDDVMTGVNPGLKEKAPDLYHFLQEFSISIQDIEEILYKAETEDKNIEELTAQWIEDHREEIDKMIRQGVEE
ncbi:glycine betaine ABC transporter substrate-binding protein [Clostridiaceae bacterium 35-E11]